MSTLIGIAYSQFEDPIPVLRGINSMRRNIPDATIVFAVDEHAPPPPNYGQDIVIRIKGFGVGRARNALAWYAYANKYNCLILSDAHVFFTSDLTRLCDKAFVQPKIVPIESDGTLASWGNVGSYRSFKSWHWGYVMDGDYIVMSTEPVGVYSYDALDALFSVQGMFTVAEYWGSELWDATLSLSRLGFTLYTAPRDVVGHVYKSGSVKQWTRRFSETPCTWEPWCGEYVDSNYGFSIAVGNYAYALKHYGASPPNESRDLSKYLKPYVLQAINEFNKNAKYSIIDVYNRFQYYIESGYIRQWSDLDGGNDIWY